jgi:DNA-directed RNA polymerase subunit RPC12/RpoP
MSPTLDWTCSHCGNRETWELVKTDEAEGQPAHPAADPRTLDYSCSRCGTTETWMLVKAEAVASGR